MTRRTKEERLELELTREGLDMLADERERARAPRAEMRRLSQYMKREGARLVAEEVPGIGLIYRPPARSTAPFGPATVEKWCARHKKTPPSINA